MAMPILLMLVLRVKLRKKTGLLLCRKEAEDFYHLVHAGWSSAAELVEVFWFFSTEKNTFLSALKTPED
jgi:hypothetical protein